MFCLSLARVLISRTKDKVQGHQGQNALCTAITPRQRRNGIRLLQIMSCTCRSHNSVAAGVISAACVRSMFGKTSLALVFLASVSVAFEGQGHRLKFSVTV